ncbi:MAG: hypothetical protein A2086_08955 [Spirochaetes bacterium GWD1_27_9]|nr:MAG: hypothetical protein A2Z98_08535 [Spirochaetes bacterium GWB1_27_13]OHD20906.1 MAG: hypothetical protein A2Y34_11775 [Spirochaetes bacterium GWC1_27_15]OHD44708.1 MAG: hypothetical protein A2086_08955 [Spirochaetes bacterium GWD1_27_9]
MLRKKDLPVELTHSCYIDFYDGNYCLFYKSIPMIIVNYQFWTEDIKVRGDYIDYDPDENGYTILIDIPTYEDGKLTHIDHIYYGLFDTLKEFDEWLTNPYYLY